MDILMVNPPSGFLADERVFPSLGILKVAAALENAGIAFGHLALSGVENNREVMVAALMDSNPAAIGFTATTPQLPAVRALAAEARSNSDAKLILGGPHATLAFAARKMEEKRGTSSRATMATKWL